MPERSNEQIVRDQEMQAKSISEIVTSLRTVSDDVSEIKQTLAVKAVKDEYRDDRIKAINDLIKLAVGALIVQFIGAVFFILKSGIINVP